MLEKMHVPGFLLSITRGSNQSSEDAGLLLPAAAGSHVQHQLARQQLLADATRLHAWIERQILISLINLFNPTNLKPPEIPVTIGPGWQWALRLWSCAVQNMIKKCQRGGSLLASHSAHCQHSDESIRSG